MQEESLPDLGLFYLSKGGQGKNYYFYPFRIYYFARVGKKLYSTSTAVTFSGSPFLATLDFSEEMYKEYLKYIPIAFANLLEDIFKGAFTNPKEIDFPYPIDLNIDATLGEMISYEDEQYIPFLVTKIGKLE